MSKIEVIQTLYTIAALQAHYARQCRIVAQTRKGSAAHNAARQAAARYAAALRAQGAVPGRIGRTVSERVSAVKAFA